MKLLLLSDLHSRQAWFDWIAAQSVDAVLVAGDLLDGFSPGGLLPQTVAVSQWAARLRCPLAISSGNHDANFPGAIPPTELEGMDPCSRSLPLESRWMDTLDRPGVIVDDRRSKRIHGDSRFRILLALDFGHADHRGFGRRISEGNGVSAQKSNIDSTFSE